MIRIYETRVISRSLHPKLGLLQPGQLRPLDEEVAALYCDRTHEVPDEETGELVERPVDGIIREWAPESAEAIAKHRREVLEALAPALGITDADDAEAFPNKTELAAAIFKALPARPKKKQTSE
jgi:hypothetical protein